jgi:hypothetical protein
MASQLLFAQLPALTIGSDGHMQAGLIDIESADWREILSRAKHDVYQLPNYVGLAAHMETGTPQAYFARDGMRELLVPLVIRETSSWPMDSGHTVYDASSPYGYPGLLVTDPEGRGVDAFVSEALGVLGPVLAEVDVVSVFVRLHPFLWQPLELLAALGTLVYHGDTVGIDLHLADDEILMGIKKKHRRFVRKIQELDHHVDMTDSIERIDEFLDVYYENMDRVQASDYYYFPRQYFFDLFESLPGKVHLAFLEIGDRVACVDLLTEVDGIIECHLGATRTEFLSCSPSIPLTYYECLWAKKRGDKLLHLGGGVGGKEDSLFAFKAGFSQLRFPFYTWRRVINHTAYKGLALAWAKERGLAPDALEGYFPAYRKPAG